MQTEKKSCREAREPVTFYQEKNQCGYRCETVTVPESVTSLNLFCRRSAWEDGSESADVFAVLALLKRYGADGMAMLNEIGEAAESPRPMDEPFKYRVPRMRGTSSR